MPEPSPARNPGVVAVSLVLCVVIALVSRHAVAQQGSCSPAAHAWVHAASAAVSLPIRLDACLVHQRVQLEPPGANPMSVEVARGPGPSFRQAGSLRLSPILEVSDFAELPAAQRDAFDRFAGWVAAHDSEVSQSFEASTSPLVPKQDSAPRTVPWLLMAGIAMALALVARRIAAPRAVGSTGWSRADGLAVAGTGFVAGAARLAAGPWGPLHINGQGPMWLLRLTEARDAQALYGPGYTEVWHGLASVVSSAPDTAVFAGNASLGAMAAPLCFALARGAGLDIRRALLAAACIALDPVSTRIGATESYLPLIITLTLASCLLVQQSTVLLFERPGARVAVTAAAAGLFVAQAARVHPVAWLPAALVPLVVFSVPRARSWRARMGAFALVTLAMGGVVLATSAADLLTAFRAARAHGSVADAPPFLVSAPLVVAGLVIVAAVLWLPRIRALALVWAPALLAALATRHIYGGSSLWQSAYDRLFLVWPLIGIMALVPEWLFARRRWLLPSAALSAIVIVLGWPTVRDRTTDHDEYVFVRKWARTLPADCRVMYVSRAAPRVDLMPEYVAPSAEKARFVRLEVSDGTVVLPKFAENECVFFLRTGLCSSKEGRAACDSVASAFELTPELSTSLQAKASRNDLPYDRDLVEIVVSRARPRRGGL